MFAVLYKCKVKKGQEDLYVKHWKKVAGFFKQSRGSLGSTLHKAEDGTWIAYSKWPDRATRDASWPKDKEAVNAAFPPDVQEAIIGLKATLEEDTLTEICMEIEEQI